MDNNMTTFTMINGNPVSIGDTVSFEYIIDSFYGRTRAKCTETLTVENAARLMDMGVLKKEYWKIAEAGGATAEDDVQHDFADNNCRMMDNMVRERRAMRWKMFLSVNPLWKKPFDDNTDFIHWFAMKKMHMEWNIFADMLRRGEFYMDETAKAMVEENARLCDEKFDIRMREYDIHDIKGLYVIRNNERNGRWVFEPELVTDRDAIMEIVSEEKPFYRLFDDCSSFCGTLNKIFYGYATDKERKKD